jgi:transketolase
MPARRIGKARLHEQARLVRLETLRMTDLCGSGRHGSRSSMAEILAALDRRCVHVRASEPQ